MAVLEQRKERDVAIHTRKISDEAQLLMLDSCNGWLSGGVVNRRDVCRLKSEANTARLRFQEQESPDSRSQSHRTIAGYRRPEKEETTETVFLFGTISDDEKGIISTSKYLYFISHPFGRYRLASSSFQNISAAQLPSLFFVGVNAQSYLVPSSSAAASGGRRSANRIIANQPRTQHPEHLV
ncbi:hypothetical protein GLAREA_09354 [Glarea lozoyensis ATCC 20868]|uniref:Uncharacterized protein n=1 Tax=Glarea lozoyensis (strain ATCC 20868 / MF5171) TaxID=1116229 RepID=S3CT53_GLAL2|nr:uncharacterized protein GLAREA_09354 [Glarea lozoyensis ATCC 20868]EPE28234.1 hypothetical protein GLAREA_09354 [Glarea lozoyensis ATCC 20868]